MAKISKVVVIGSRPIIIAQAAGSIHLLRYPADAFRFIEEGERS